jgi:hypothetical protein
MQFAPTDLILRTSLMEESQRIGGAYCNPPLLHSAL